MENSIGAQLGWMVLLLETSSNLVKTTISDAERPHLAEWVERGW